MLLVVVVVTPYLVIMLYQYSCIVTAAASTMSTTTAAIKVILLFSQYFIRDRTSVTCQVHAASLRTSQSPAPRKVFVLAHRQLPLQRLDFRIL